MSEVSKSVDCLIVGKKPALHASISLGRLEEISNELFNRIKEGRVAPSKCAHAMCLSAANGYVPVVRMLSAQPQSAFNQAYNFSEPLRRSIRSWLKAKQGGEGETQARCGDCAKLLIQSGADLHSPDKYLKSKLSAFDRLTNDHSVEANDFLRELQDLSFRGQKRGLDEENTVNEVETTSRSKKRIRKD
jgi:hypothetical protein